jgi:hypothetical protein
MHFAQAFAQADVFGAAVSRDGTPGPRAPPRSLPHPDDRSSTIRRASVRRAARTMRGASRDGPDSWFRAPSGSRVTR